MNQTSTPTSGTTSSTALRGTRAQLFGQRFSLQAHLKSSLLSTLFVLSFLLGAGGVWGQDINGGTSWSGWTLLGESDQSGIYASGSTSDKYEIYTTVFQYITSNPIPGNQAGFTNGNVILGIGVKRLSGTGNYVVIKADPNNNSYQPASPGPARTSFGIWADAGDWIVHHPNNYSGQPSEITIKKSPSNAYVPCGSFGCGNGLPGIRGVWANSGESFQMFYDLNQMKASYSDLANFGSNFTFSINYNGTDVVIQNLPLPVVNTTKGLVYTTIQAAINAADAGDVIEVAAGTYSENVTINKADLTLKSSVEHGAVITSATGNIVTISADGVTLDGFELDGTGRTNNFAGLQLSGNNALIKNNRFLGNSPDAGTNTTVSNAQGILFSGSNNNATIQDNYFTKWLTGIFNQASTGGYISGNTFENVRSSTANDNVVDYTYIGNTFINCWNGISQGADATGFFVIQQNTFTSVNNSPVIIRAAGASINNNSFASAASSNFPPVNNISSPMVQVDATCNWWGQDTGPEPLQTGGNVDVSSWLINNNLVNPTCTNASGVVVSVLDGTTNDFKSGWPTIQAAINAADAGDIVDAPAGTYEEQVYVWKPLTLRGPNAGVEGNGTRQAEAVITYPDPLPAGSWYYAIYTDVDNVTIDGFEVRDHPAALSTLQPILIYTNAVNNFTLRNNRIIGGDLQLFMGTSGGQNVYRTGMMVERNYFDGGPFVNSVFHRAMYIQGTAGTIQDNVIENANIGIQYMPYQHTTSGLIQRNTISAGLIGLYHNYQNLGAAPVTYQDNVVTISPNDQLGEKLLVNTPWDTPVVWRGIHVITHGIQNTGNLPEVSFLNNQIDGALDPNEIYNSTLRDAFRISNGKSGTVTLLNNSFENFTTGVNVVNDCSGSCNATVTATCNWWGTSNFTTVTAAAGTANTFLPYLTDGTDDDPAIGFQPVANSCNMPVTVYSDLAETNIVSGHTTIQAAINAATTLNGYVVRVQAGTYAITSGTNKSLTIRGANAGISANDGIIVNGARNDEAILTNGGIFRLTGTAAVVFDGFTIQAGGANGMFDSYETGTSLAIRNSIVQNQSTQFFFSNPVLFEVSNSRWTGSISRRIVQIAGNYDGNNACAALIENNVFRDWGVGTSSIIDGFNFSAVQTTITGNYFDGGLSRAFQLANSVGDMNITGNTFTEINGVGTGCCTWEQWGMDNAAAIYLQNSNFTNPVTISGNYFSNSTHGIFIQNTQTGSWSDPKWLEISENSFTGTFTNAAIRNDVAVPANATCNWYGTLNANDIASKIIGSVDFSPWLVSGTDDDPSTAGFQPETGTCTGTPVVIASATPTAAICDEQGNIEVSFSGGTGPYDIVWTNSEPVVNVSSTYTISDLSAGTYGITITDANGSTASTSVVVQYLPVHNTTANTRHATIQAAVTAAATGAVLEVCAGTYNETVAIGSTALTLNGNNAGEPGAGFRSAESVVTGGFVLNGSANVTIDGFSVTGSNVAGSRGILMGNTGTVPGPITVVNNIIENWTTGISLGGGATSGWVSGVSVSGNLIRNNTAGIGSTENVADLAVTDNTFSNNEEGIGLGGGLTGFVVTGNTFTTDNTVYIASYAADLMPAFSGLFADNIFTRAAGVDDVSEPSYVVSAIYPTIGAAITNASAGANIQVAAGTYDENVTVNKLVHLRGANYDVCYNDDRDAESVIAGLVTVSAAGASLDGFTLTKKSTSTTGNGINFSDWSGVSLNVTGSNTAIRNNIVEMYGGAGGTDNAVILNAAGAVAFECNEVKAGAGYLAEDDGRGVSALRLTNAASAYTITGNRFAVSSGRNLTASNSADAVSFFNVGDAAFDGNLVEGNIMGGVVMFGGLGEISITNNTIQDYTTALAGIRVVNCCGYNSATAAVTISGNFIEGTAGTTGIGIIGAPAEDIVALSNNSITGNSTSIAFTGTGTLDATCNWYGTTDVTAIAASMAGNISFQPYLSSGTDSDLNTAGFQPSPGAQPGYVASVTGNNQPISNGSTSYSATNLTLMGSAPVGGSLVRNYTFTSATSCGASNGATFTSLEFTGDAAARFSFGGVVTNTEYAAGSHNFTISYEAHTTEITDDVVAVMTTSSGVYTFALRAVTVEPVAIPAVAEILGNNVVIANGSFSPNTSNHTNFGTLSIPGTLTRTFTVRNAGANGAEALEVGAISITGAEAGNFAVTTNGCASASLGSGQSCTFTVTYTGSTGGVSNATIAVANSDAARDPYEFAIRAELLSASVSLTGNNQTIANGSCAPVASNHTFMGSQTITRTFSFKNLGLGGLEIGANAVSISAATGCNGAWEGHTNFTVATQPAVGVYSTNQTGFFQVTYTVPGQGEFYALVTLVTENAGAFTFAVQGNGPSPRMQVLGNNQDIPSGSTTTSTSNFTDFGTRNLNSSLTRIFSVRNPGSLGAQAPLNLTGNPRAVVSGDGAAMFAVTIQPGSPIGVNGNTSFRIRYLPTSHGCHVATITIASNDPARNPYTFVVRGGTTGNACPPEPEPAGGFVGVGVNEIGGIIATEENKTINNVQVEVNGGTSITFANVQGEYSLNMPEGSNYLIAPMHDVAPANGVTTWDLVLISRHILGIQPLTSPYKIIAADANRSNSVTTLDMVAIRRVILQLDMSFQNNTSWRFVDKSFVFPNPSNPFQTSFPEVITLNNVSADHLVADFVAVKVGDVDGNASGNFTGEETEQRSFKGTLAIQTEEVELEPGTTYRLAFRASEMALFGYQFTLNFDRQVLSFEDIVPALANAEHFGLALLDEGSITTSWNSGNAVELSKDQELFTLVFKARSNARLSEVLTLDSRFTVAEAYDSQGGELNVSLGFTGQTGKGNFMLYQNTPNPFTGITQIGFHLPEASPVTIRVVDVSGKVIKMIRGNFSQGYNEVQIDDMKTSGVYYYRVDTPEYTATRKMVVQ